MNYRGHIEKGVVVLDESVVLPEGAQVKIIVSDSDSEEALHPDIVRFTGIIPAELDVKSEYQEAMRNRQI